MRRPHLLLLLLVACESSRVDREAFAEKRRRLQKKGHEHHAKPPQPPPKHAVTNATVAGRAPSCGGCSRRESMLTKQMRLDHYAEMYNQLGPIKSVLTLLTLLSLITMCIRTFYKRVSGELLVTLMYILLYFIASPFAIVINKVLMKDYGFGYPVMVSALGQSTTALCSAAAVKGFGLSVENGRHVGLRSLLTLGGASAFALVLGQYPYLYLTVAFIQMLKARDLV